MRAVRIPNGKWTIYSLTVTSHRHPSPLIGWCPPSADNLAMHIPEVSVGRTSPSTAGAVLISLRVPLSLPLPTRTLQTPWIHPFTSPSFLPSRLTLSFHVSHAEAEKLLSIRHLPCGKHVTVVNRLLFKQCSTG